MAKKNYWKSAGTLFSHVNYWYDKLKVISSGKLPVQTIFAILFSFSFFLNFSGNLHHTGHNDLNFIWQRQILSQVVPKAEKEIQ